jgi:hypothetical protein
LNFPILPPLLNPCNSFYLKLTSYLTWLTPLLTSSMYISRFQVSAQTSTYSRTFHNKCPSPNLPTITLRLETLFMFSHSSLYLLLL